MCEATPVNARDVLEYEFFSGAHFPRVSENPYSGIFYVVNVRKYYPYSNSNTEVKAMFSSIQYRNLLKTKLGCFWPFSHVYTID